ncbi:MAG TPA: hypothetical protein VNZ57_01905 [Longimicrobiales bacterium]|nr:hypothetical protein [Longimicrobiales bacterium]
MRVFTAKTLAGVVVASVAVAFAARGSSTEPASGVAGAVLPQVENRIVTTEVTLADDRTQLRLEFADGAILDVSFAGGRVDIDGEEVGSYAAGDLLDRAWRALLRAVVDTPPAELGVLLSAWPAPAGTAGEAVAAALARAVGQSSEALPATGSVQADGAAADSLRRLEARVQALERVLREMESSEVGAAAQQAVPAPRANRNAPLGPAARFVRNFWRGFNGVVTTVIAYGILLAIGCAVVFFGRRYLEGAADTIRHATVRSGLVGLAATVLVLPAFAIGAVALAISIVGIPLLIVWIPLFPVAVVLAAVVGFLATAHAAGEAMAERRLHGVEWFKANSYYFLATGLALLAAAFVASFLVQMVAGVWLGFLHGLLLVVGIIVIWLAVTLGLGALLLSRFGTRPASTAADPDLALPFDE